MPIIDPAASTDFYVPVVDEEAAKAAPLAVRAAAAAQDAAHRAVTQAAEELGVAPRALSTALTPARIKTIADAAFE